MQEIRTKIRGLFGKTYFKNGMWMYFLQIFNTIIPLLTLPYITRILGASQYGIFSIALNIIGYLQVLVEYGFGMSATRKVALSNEKEQVNKLFSAVLFARVLLLVLAAVLAGIYLLFHREDRIQILCLLILFIGLFGNCIQQNWLYQGLQDMKYISIISIISRSLSVILIFLLVKGQQDLLLYCLLYSAATVVNGLLGLLAALKKYNLSIVKTGFDDIFNEIKSGWYVFTTQLSSKVFGAIGITFLGIFSTETEVGMYSAIQKIPNMMILAWSPISMVLYPIASKKLQESYEEGKNYIFKLRKIFLFLFSGAAVMIAVFSKYVIEIAFGQEYGKFFYWVIPLLIWLVVAINNNFWGIQLLLGSGHDKEYGKCFQISVVCTIVINFVFIYFWGGDGASIAAGLSEVILAVLLWRQIKRLS